MTLNNGTTNGRFQAAKDDHDDGQSVSNPRSDSTSRISFWRSWRALPGCALPHLHAAGLGHLPDRPDRSVVAFLGVSPARGLRPPVPRGEQGHAEHDLDRRPVLPAPAVVRPRQPLLPPRSEAAESSQLPAGRPPVPEGDQESPGDAGDLAEGEPGMHRRGRLRVPVPLHGPLLDQEEPRSLHQPGDLVLRREPEQDDHQPLQDPTPALLPHGLPARRRPRRGPRLSGSSPGR